MDGWVDGMSFGCCDTENKKMSRGWVLGRLVGHVLILDIVTERNGVKDRES